MTSSSARQIKNILWREVKAMHARAKIPIGGTLYEDPASGLKAEDGREIIGFSTDQPERAAGISGKNILYIIDEASGVNEAVYEAIEGNLAGGAYIVLFSNPTRTSGTFYEAFTSKKQFWKTIHISSENTPNAASGQIIIPGLATKDWVDEKREWWGEDSPLYAVRVRGDFPSQSENAVIGLGLVEAAVARYNETPADGPLVIGVDVARYGDDETVIYPRRGKKPLDPVVLMSMDGIEVAGKVMETVRRLRRQGEIPVVRVDVIGYGSSAYDHLSREREIEAIPVDVSKTSPDENYMRVRDQLWFNGAHWLKDGGALPDDGKLLGELVAPTYTFDNNGRMRVLSKDEIKKLLKRSPDRADAFLLSIMPDELSSHPDAFGESLSTDMSQSIILPKPGEVESIMRGTFNATLGSGGDFNPFLQSK